MTAFEPERLLEILVEEGVDFVLVGGYAAVLRGASRPTEDIDVTPSTTTENLTRLTDALQRLNAKIRTDAVPEGLLFSTSAEAMRGLLIAEPGHRLRRSRPHLPALRHRWLSRLDPERG